jgi:hypothetical protein
MEVETFGKTVLAAGWTEILDQMQVSLSATLATATKREQKLKKEASAKGKKSAFLKHGQDCRNRFDEHLARIHACLQQADQKAQEVELFLDSGLDGISQWQAKAESLRQRLANWEAQFIK